MPDPSRHRDSTANPNLPATAGLDGLELAMFLIPCAIGGFFILIFAVTLRDRQLAKADKPAWSLRELASTFYVNPRKNPDFAWAFISRFLFVLAYAFLTTYQAYYLLA